MNRNLLYFIITVVAVVIVALFFTQGSDNTQITVPAPVSGGADASPMNGLTGRTIVEQGDIAGNASTIVPDSAAALAPTTAIPAPIEPAVPAAGMPAAATAPANAGPAAASPQAATTGAPASDELPVTAEVSGEPAPATTTAAPAPAAPASAMPPVTPSER